MNSGATRSEIHEVKCLETELPGVLIIEPELFTDERGIFFETYNERKYRDCGASRRFVQDNCVHSVYGVVRGLHYQLTNPQAKLCTVLNGEVLDVVVDVRPRSYTFKRWIGVVLSDRNRRQIYIPEGFAHGYEVRSPTADFFYKCSAFYAPEDQKTIAWNDPELGIGWGVKDPILSGSDRCALPMSRLSPGSLPT